MAELPIQPSNGSLHRHHHNHGRQTNQVYPMHSIEEHIGFLDQFLDHDLYQVETALTSPINQAFLHMAQGREFLQNNPIDDHERALLFFDDMM